MSVLGGGRMIDELLSRTIATVEEIIQSELLSNSCVRLNVAFNKSSLPMSFSSTGSKKNMVMAEKLTKFLEPY